MYRRVPYILVAAIFLYCTSPYIPAEAADTGGPIFRDTCTQITAPVTNKVLCWEQTTASLKFWNGSTWALTTSSVGSIGGTANQITVTQVGSAVTLSLPSTVIAPGTVTGALTDRGGQVYNLQANYGGAASGVLPSNTAAANVAAFNALLALVPTGSTVYCPPGNYPINGSITLLNPIRLTGAGDGCNFVVDAATGAATDLFVLAPSVGGADVPIFELSHFRISGNFLGTAARHAIYLNGASGGIRNLLITRLKVDHVGTGQSIYGDGAGAGNGTPSHSTITDNRLVAGIKFIRAGDNIRIANNEIYGYAAGVSSWGLDYIPTGGAGSLLVHGNLFAGTGAIIIRGGDGITTGAASGVMLTENQIEAGPGTNGAVIDIDGSAATPAEGVVISGGTIQIPTSHGIRVNHASQTVIRGVRIKRGSAPGSKDILITANAVDTTVETNEWVDGLPITDMISDAGTRTVVMAAVNGGAYLSPRVGVGTTAPAHPLDVVGVIRGEVLATTSTVGGAFTATGLRQQFGGLMIDTVFGANATTRGSWKLSLLESDGGGQLDPIQVASTGVVSLSLNAAALPTEIAGSLLRLGQVDATSNILTMDAAAAANVLVGRRSSGTFAAPTATASGVSTFQIQSRGYDATNLYGLVDAALSFTTAEAYTATAHGTKVTVTTTPVGSITSGVTAEFGPGPASTFTGTVTATTFIGALTGNAATATALAADPADCAAGTVALGINAAGTAQCTATPSVTSLQGILGNVTPAAATATNLTATNLTVTGTVTVTGANRLFLQNLGVASISAIDVTGTDTSTSGRLFLRTFKSDGSGGQDVAIIGPAGVVIGGTLPTTSQAKTIFINATTHANLGTPDDGTYAHCSDCTIANPCASGGSGAFAKRLGGAWVCN